MDSTLYLKCQLSSIDAGLTLLNVLTDRFPYHDAGKWQELIEGELVLLNGEPPAPDTVVRGGDSLVYKAVDFQEPAVATEWKEALKTPDLLLVDKPAGTPVSRTGLIIRNTLVNILRRHYSEDIHLLHRLDRETGGLLLCARSREACRKYQGSLPGIITGKYYLAVVQGRFAPSNLEVLAPLDTKPDSPVRCRMWVDPEGKKCRTIFHGISATGDFSLVLAELATGRRHQIRAHLAHLGHPLVGDKIYSHDGKFYLKRIGSELTEEDYQRLGAENHTLHAWAMRLKVPGQPEKLYFSGKFSPDMDKLLRLFPGWREKSISLVHSLGR